MLADQLWRIMSVAEVVLEVSFSPKLFVTPLLLTTETPFFEVHSPDVFRQVASVGKFRGALIIVAHQLLLPMSCRALVRLHVTLAPKDPPTVASLALECLFGKVNNSHVLVERML